MLQLSIVFYVCRVTYKTIKLYNISSYLNCKPLRKKYFYVISYNVQYIYLTESMLMFYNYKNNVYHNL